MQNIVINMCEKFRYDRLRNDRALGNGKSDNNKNSKNKNKNNVRGHWDPFPSPITWQSHTRTITFGKTLYTDKDTVYIDQ